MRLIQAATVAIALGGLALSAPADAGPRGDLNGSAWSGAVVRVHDSDRGDDWRRWRYHRRGDEWRDRDDDRDWDRHHHRRGDRWDRHHRRHYGWWRGRHLGWGRGDAWRWGRWDGHRRDGDWRRGDSEDWDKKWDKDHKRREFRHHWR